MTNLEQTKKEIKNLLKKDSGNWNRAFTMNATQMANRTATLCTVCAYPFLEVEKYAQQEEETKRIMEVLKANGYTVVREEKTYPSGCVEVRVRFIF